MFPFNSIGRRAAAAAISWPVARLCRIFRSIRKTVRRHVPACGQGRGTISLEGGAREAIPVPRATYAVRSDGELPFSRHCAAQATATKSNSPAMSWPAAGGKLTGDMERGDAQCQRRCGRHDLRVDGFQVVVRAGTFSADLVLTTRGQFAVGRDPLRGGGEFQGRQHHADAHLIVTDNFKF